MRKIHIKGLTTTRVMEIGDIYSYQDVRYVVTEKQKLGKITYEYKLKPEVSDAK